MAHHKIEKKEHESKAGKLKIHGGFKSEEKMGHEKKHEGKRKK